MSKTSSTSASRGSLDAGRHGARRESWQPAAPLTLAGSGFGGMAIVALALALAGCGGGEPTAPRTQTAPTPSASPTAAPRERKAAPQDIEYRPVEATSRRSGEKIVIQVPENVEFDSGRMIEYREGPDGKYYFVSLIPQ